MSIVYDNFIWPYFHWRFARMNDNMIIVRWLLPQGNECQGLAWQRCYLIAETDTEMSSLQQNIHHKIHPKLTTSSAVGHENLVQNTILPQSPPTPVTFSSCKMINIEVCIRLVIHASFISLYSSAFYHMASYGILSHYHMDSLWNTVSVFTCNQYCLWNIDTA